MAIKPRTTEVTIYQGDDRARLSVLLDRIDEAKRRSKEAGPLLGGEVDPVQAAVDEYNAFRDEASERAEVFTMQALGRLAWRNLRAAHPARDDRPEDKVFGANDDSFPAALIAECWQADPGVDKAAEVDALCQADYLLLAAHCWQLNTAQGLDPKALTLSDVMPTSDAM